MGTVYLTAPAPAGGVDVALRSSASLVTVPATVTVAQGATSVQFPIVTGPSIRNVKVTILATYGGVTKSARFLLVK